MTLSSTLETLKINWPQSELLRLKVPQMPPWMKWSRKTGIWRVKLLHLRQMLPSTYLKNWKGWKQKMGSSEEIRSHFWRWNNPDLIVSFITCFITTNQGIFSIILTLPLFFPESSTLLSCFSPQSHTLLFHVIALPSGWHRRADSEWNRGYCSPFSSTFFWTFWSLCSTIVSCWVHP